METVSLFSGAMGLDLGLEAAGLSIVSCAESDRDCQATIKANRPLCRLFSDVQEINKDTSPRRPFLVAGGPPCQSFSTMGRRLSFSDPRGMLIYEFGRVVDQLRPRFFVMENVKGIASAKGQEDGKSALDEALENFARIGYRTVHGVMMAADYGVPQFRERVVIIGSRDNEPVFLPKPTHFALHQHWLYLFKTLRDTIWHLRDAPGDCAQFSPDRLQFLAKVPPGGNWTALGETDQAVAMGGAYESEGGRTGFYRRLAWDEPSPTLVTSPTQKSTMLCHPDRERPLSVAEYAAIQQFPPNWVLQGSMASRYKQLGNAVPVGMGRAIGQALVAVANGTFRISSKRLR